MMARAIDKETMLGLIIEAKRTDPETGSFAEWLAEYLVEHLPALAQPNEWVSVEERLPEDEARQYIEDDLDGIGYLYPCLLTYKSPNTERIHVVRFYYDIIQKWFVNNGEALCEKGRCIAWMPLPVPYDRRPPEGEAVDMVIEKLKAERCEILNAK